MTGGPGGVSTSLMRAWCRSAISWRSFRNSVALQAAVLFAGQINPYVCNVIALPEIVVTHQTVEIHRRTRADVAGVIGDFGDRSQVGFDLTHPCVRSLQSRALIEVENEQELVLVVEGEHL